MLLQKITKNFEYQYISANAARIVTRGFVLLGCPKEGQEGVVRFGVIASRKLGGAVRRNKVKRRLRMICQQAMPEHGTAGWDYVLIGRYAGHDMEFEKMLRDLKAALKNVAIAPKEKDEKRI